MDGWVKFHRHFLDSNLWLSEPFTKAQAWIDLFSLANYKDGFIRVRGNRVEVKRGQVGWSQLKLSKRWKWSRGKVRRFLDELEIKEKKIVQQKNKITTLINIENYTKYQGSDTTDGQQTVQQTDIKQYTNKKEKKEKKINGYKEICQKVILKINKTGNKNFKLIQTNFDFIIPRLKEGFTEADCFKVIHNKNVDPNFSNQYFKPETLFRKSKFEGYLNENPKKYKTFKSNQPNWKKAF